MPCDNHDCSDDDMFFGRVSISPGHIINDNGRRRVSSAVFKPSKQDLDGLSGNLWGIFENAELYTEEYESHIGILMLAKNVRRIPNLYCQHDPQEGNCSHSLIVGYNRELSNKIIKSVAEQLAKISTPTNKNINT